MLWRIALCMVVVCGSLVGCGGAGPRRVAVSGVVMVDGQFVKQGTIQFISRDVPGPLVSAPIVDGGFVVDQKRGPVLGRHEVNVLVHEDLGFEIDDDGAYADAQSRTRRAASPFGNGKPVFQQEADRLVHLESDAELQFLLVSSSQGAPRHMADARKK